MTGWCLERVSLLEEPSSEAQPGPQQAGLIQSRDQSCSLTVASHSGLGKKKEMQMKFKCPAPGFLTIREEVGRTVARGPQSPTWSWSISRGRLAVPRTKQKHLPAKSILRGWCWSIFPQAGSYCPHFPGQHPPECPKA